MMEGWKGRKGRIGRVLGKWRMTEGVRKGKEGRKRAVTGLRGGRKGRRTVSGGRGRREELVVQGYHMVTAVRSPCSF